MGRRQESHRQALTSYTTELLLGAEIEFLDILSRRGEPFYAEIDSLLERLRHFPKLGSVYCEPFRKLLIKNAPYGVFYTIEGRRIVVIAILDLRMHPDRILVRLEKQ